MKRLSILLIAFLTVFPLFAVTENPATGSISKGSSDTATLDFQVNLGTVNTYKIGFSSVPVSDFEEVSGEKLLTSVQNLIIDDGDFTGHLEDGSVHVFWQIQSNKGCKVSLTAGDMDGKSETLNIQLSTTPGTATSELFNVDNGKAVTGDWTTEDSLSGGEIFSFTPSADNNNQVVGSQKVSIVTENFQGRPAETFTGTMTLTIEGI